MLRRTRATWQLLTRSPWFAALTITVGALLAWPHTRITENDLFLHILLGDWIRSGGARTGNPTWTYGPHQDTWINTLAIPETVFSWLHQHTGWALLTLMHTKALAAVAVTTFLAVIALTPRPALTRSPWPLRLAFASALIAPLLSYTQLTIRPQTIPLALLPLAAIPLMRIIRTGHLPHPLTTFLITLAWANWHGYATLVAPVLTLATGAYITAAITYPRSNIRTQLTRRLHRTRRALLTIPAALIATLLTPAGVGIYTAALTLRDVAPHFIAEWHTLTLASTTGRILTALLALWLALAAHQLSTHRTTHTRATILSEALLLTGMTILAVQQIRTAITALLIITVIITSRAIRTLIHTGTSTAHPRTIRPRITLTITAIAMTLGSTIAIINAHHAAPDVTYQPTALYQRALTLPEPRRIFTEGNITSGLLWYATTHHTPVSVPFDGRVDRYDKATIARLLLLTQQHTPTPLLDALWTNYDTSTAALIDNTTDLANYLRAKGWTTIASTPGTRWDNTATTWVLLAAPRP